MSNDQGDLVLLDLTAMPVDLEQLYLDPNNPRLSSLADEAGGRVDDESALTADIQSELLLRIKDGAIGIDDLTAKIRANGFLGIDRIVVRPVDPSVPGSTDNYIVLEGNRRVAALKSLWDNVVARAALSPKVRDSIPRLEVLKYDGLDEGVAWQIQGLRHIESIKQWGAFQRAKYLHDTGKTPAALKDLSGISTQEINRLLRSYSAFQQAVADEDWGDQLQEEDFSIFSEAVFKKPALREWLEWDDAFMRFKNSENLRTLLRLRKEQVNGGSYRIQKVNPDLRDKFSRLVMAGNERYLSRFLNDDSLELDAVYAELVRDEEQAPPSLERDLKTVRETASAVEHLAVMQIVRDADKFAEFSEALNALSQNVSDQLALLAMASQQLGSSEGE